ncbi:D-alanine--D-alanine ligase [Altibacter sp. HG106]|uniref:D-alanine--D-alanine ligase n=1 Tax=Altibacter sp. HG106 TaxID=3023937 RepID=UPI002350FD86|nr:D-alanine--D-alanine ligase [Altibacter sp. HG106]MDC7996078.1 D-alanine--D-alanine ligase [Altibacter sp. HG106]
MKKKQVAVAMGGYSSERDISLKSGGIVCEFLDTKIYDVYPIHILSSGWFYVPNASERVAVDKADFSFEVAGKKVVPDIIFNTIHGTPGEDGILAAYWHMLGIPQTSADYYQAALSFNKRDCLSVLKNFGIHVANSYYLNHGSEVPVEEIIKRVGLPCFVKPNRAGSSFGISKVKEMDALLPALEKAFLEDKEVLIESALKGTEVSVGTYRNNGEIVVLPITEIVSENEFFDYEAKYEGKSEEITPARISEALEEAIRKEAIRIYQVLNMNGITRSEFILQDDIPHFIETNTTPGLSKESIIPKQVRAAGLTLTDFFGYLVESASLEK